MKHLISRRNFLKAAGVTTAAAAMAVGAPAASACWTGEKSEVTILYTNDVHTYIDKQAPELTYAAIAALKQSYQNAGKKVLLVDAGDHVQGTAYGSMDQGASIIELMNAAGYDVATPGNLRTNLRVLPEIKVFVRGGVRIAFVGITTPETFTKSTPAYFMNKAQTKYIYDILGGEDGQKLYSAVQKAVDKAKCLADVVIGLGHLGVDPSSFANVGEMTIAPDGIISTRLVSTYDQEDPAVAAEQAAWVSSVDEMLGEKIAVADTKFYITDPVTGKRRIRSGETNLGDFVADGIYTYFNEVEQLHCDIAIMNGGGIRSDEDAGYWTFKTCKQVSPFGNVACLMSVTGKQIQDALEFAARFAGAEGKENGGFLQVAGATYEIHTDIPNTVQTDDKNVWIGSATGTPRVQNVKIYDRANGTYVPLDESKTYALAGMNYTLRNLGDGFAMFDGAELIKDYVSEDYLVMSTYAMTFGGVDAEGLPHLSSANSVLAEYPGYLLDYENPYGAGRISIL